MSLATEKDELLRKINSAEIDINFHDYEFIMGDQKEFGDLFRRHQAELFLKGYIRRFPEVEEAFYIRLTPKGQVFLGDGGYTFIEQTEQKEEKKRKSELRWKMVYESGTLIVAALAALISLVALFSKDDQIKELQQRIDSLGHQVNRLERLKAIPPGINKGKSKTEVSPPASRTN